MYVSVLIKSGMYILVLHVVLYIHCMSLIKCTILPLTMVLDFDHKKFNDSTSSLAKGFWSTS